MKFVIWSRNPGFLGVKESWGYFESIWLYVEVFLDCRGAAFLVAISRDGAGQFGANLRANSPSSRPSPFPTVVKFFVGWYRQVGKPSSDLISGPGNIAWGSISEQIVSLLTCRDLNAYWVVTVCIGCVLSGDLE